MRRTTTPQERDLFQAALSAPLRPRGKAKRQSRKRAVPNAAEPPPEEPTLHSGKRRTTREERELFEAAMSARAPVKKSAPKAKATAPVAKAPPQKTPTGLDGNTARKLRRGELAPDSKLDLHGLTEAAAHRALTAFMLAAHRRGDRLVLVVTGKGSPDPARWRGVLKAMVPRWLDEAPMVKLIADKRWAHLRHGGEGALYVYLRKAKA